MITVLRLNNEPIVLNAFQIESIEDGADTRVTMMNGKQFYVREPAAEIEEAVVKWFQIMYQNGTISSASVITRTAQARKEEKEHGEQLKSTEESH